MGPRRGLRLPRSRRSPGDWRTGVSPHHTMACGDVGGRVTDCAGSSVAAEWPDPEGGDGAPIPVRRLRLDLRNWVAVATANGQACSEWATKGDERRNTAAHGHGILLGAFRTALVLGVDEAGRFPGVCALGGSSARRFDTPPAAGWVLASVGVYMHKTADLAASR